MTPAQKAQQTAYNEFIADYVERHGECKATRDEAHEVADEIVNVVTDFVALCRKYKMANGLSEGVTDEALSQAIDWSTDIDGKDEAKFLAACAISAALEVAE